MKALRLQAPALLVTLALTQVAGCARAEAPQESASKPTSAAADAPAASAATAQVGAPQRTERKLVLEGELTVEVESVDAFRERLEAEVITLGGHVMNANVGHVDGKTSDGQFTLRLPPDKVPALTAKCRAWGVITQEDLRTREVTAEYYDERARLTNAHKLEERLLSLVTTQANSVKDLLEVERELARVREQIETMEGHLRLYDDQVALATLSVKATTRERFIAAAPPTFMTQAKDTLSDSSEVLANFVRNGALVCVALLPWAPAGAVLWLVARVMRRRRANVTSVAP